MEAIIEFSPGSLRPAHLKKNGLHDDISVQAGVSRALFINQSEVEMQEVNRTEMIRAAATPLECEALALLAQHENVRPSEMVRLLIRERAKQAGLWPPHDSHPDYHQARHHKTGGGGNK